MEEEGERRRRHLTHTPPPSSSISTPRYSVCVTHSMAVPGPSKPSLQAWADVGRTSGGPSERVKRKDLERRWHLLLLSPCIVRIGVL